MENAKLPIIGRVELIDLPQWNITNIDAKVDTGAYSSSVHCHHIEEFEKNGEAYVRFNLLDPDHPAYDGQLIEQKIFDRREVKSSNGISTLRYFIQTEIIIYHKTYTIELSLADRTEMKYPILLGRKFLKKKFLVDVSKKHQTLKL